MTDSGQSDTMPSRELLGLRDRLSRWTEARGWGPVALSVNDERGATYGHVIASVRGCKGFGYSSNEAINALADGMVEEGWPDDRTAQEDTR